MASAATVQRHEFSREIRDAVRACYRSDNWHGPLEALEHWAVIAFWISVSCWASKRLDLGVSVAVYVAAVFFIGGRQRAIAGLLHQACHGTLMSNGKAGAVLGAVFGGYPVFQSFTGYRSSHVTEHHGHFGHPVRDPDYAHYRKIGLCGENLRRRALRRHLLSIVGPRSTVRYVFYLLRHRILNEGEAPWETVVRIAFVCAVLIVAGVSGRLGALAAYWLVPLVTTQVWIGSLAELFEHYPLVESAPPVDIHLSWNRENGTFCNFLLGEKEGEGFHLVHHLFPRVPLWRLKEVDRILMRDHEYAALSRPKGFRLALRALFDALPG